MVSKNSTPSSNKPNNNKKSIYDNYVLEIAKTIVEKYEYPQKKHYNYEVAKLKTNRECSKGGKYTQDDVNSSVSRSLDRLSKGINSPLIRYKKYFFPNTPKYLFEKLSVDYFDYFDKRIKVDKKEVCIMSYNTCAFYATSMTEYSVSELVSDCLYDDLYSILEVDNYYQIVVNNQKELGSVPGKDSKEFTIIRALQDALFRLYEKQHKQLKRK